MASTAPTPLNPSSAASGPDTIRSEQVLELLAEHIASNDRVVSTIERAEKNIPAAAEHILEDHRRALERMPAPTVRLAAAAAPVPSPPDVRTLIHLWGAFLAVLIFTGLGFILHILTR